MSSITHTVNIDKEAGEIDLLVIVYYDWIATQYPVSMLNGRKSIIYVSHVPMNVFHSAMAADMCIKAAKHLSF